MTKLTQDLSIAQALSLIDSYAFDVGGNKPEELLQSWLSVYHSSWIRLATIEALYLGRYKTISIQQILNVWVRLGNPNTHFTHEFERLICRKLPKHLIELHDFTEESNSLTTQSPIDKADESIWLTESELPHIPNQKLQIQEKDYTYVSAGLINTTISSNDEIQKPEREKDDPRKQQSKQQDLGSTGRESLNTKSSMSLISALGIPYQPDWSQLSVEHTPIHKFIPLPDVSSFFNKLKAFAE